MIAQLLICASAAIALLLGTVHLVYTFASNKFQPRDPALGEQMQKISPVISRQTTVWRAWVGFNASHSLGAMLFGLVYGYLALAAPQALLRDGFLLGLGVVFLASMALLARRYWFNIPLIGISLALLLFVGAVMLQALPL
ncbi:hypothetical protein D3C76_1054090 [compost metagenome]|uniref:Uncharacterized protein n=2 Tax=Pseudomonas TaxID=286 RepID=A0AAP0SDW5_9PSED|nr:MULTISPECIES: hypothetical protein [Pseudomonas]KDN98686.1 hypothetical protein BV82_3414 [Pseudomonas donghuensis]MCE5983445.1 hypothetical protein [Pseudomonas sp. LF19]MCP6691032.1 hypothetical protein [Pseudomonas donghuensis]MCP6696171.1 hypothetical protein [Pseudomonas donghuensis]PJY96725.1 hypothetical protein COO64_07720 [Pseudomonas donghuensis]